MNRRQFIKNIGNISAAVAVVPTVVVGAVITAEVVDEREYTWELLGANDRWKKPTKEFTVYTNVEGYAKFETALKKQYKEDMLFFREMTNRALKDRLNHI